MHCPSCGESDTKVIDSRLLQEGKTVRRRRKCPDCEARFTTYEKLQVQLPLIVKSDGRREAFNREKVMKGLKKACQKRPIAVDRLELLLDDLEKFLLDAEGKEFMATEVGQYVMASLYDLDPVSYVRYGSFYWNFKDLEDFTSSLKNKPELKIIANKATQNELKQ
jgi:transcriptional repressor NrdR